MKWLLGSALLLLTSACMSVCDRAAALNKSFATRQAACFAEGTLTQPFDGTKCTDSMNACTAADQTALQTYFDCVERLPVCNNENRSSFNDSFLGCATRLGKLSDGCFTQ